MDEKKSEKEECQRVIWYEIRDSLSEEKGKYFQLYCFESGTGHVQFNNKLYPVIAPCIICLSEQDDGIFIGENALIHCLYLTPVIINSTFDFDVVRRNVSEFRDNQQLDIYWLLPFIQSKGLMLVGPSTRGRVVEYLKSIFKEITEQKGMFWPCRSRAILYELLNLIVNIHTAPDQLELGEGNSVDSEVQKIINYLNINYHRKITIAELTDTFATNRTTLASKFQKNIGMSVSNYLSKIRIQMACILLRDTGLLIYEIMERVGFEDSTHFGRAFRKQTGKTPSEYREEFSLLKG